MTGTKYWRQWIVRRGPRVAGELPGQQELGLAKPTKKELEAAMAGHVLAETK